VGEQRKAGGRKGAGGEQKKGRKRGGE